MEKGNEKALLYVIENYGWVLKTVVKRQMATLPHLWDDCINDTLMAVWENIGSFDEKRSRFENWLAGVFVHPASLRFWRWGIIMYFHADSNKKEKEGAFVKRSNQLMLEGPLFGSIVAYTVPIILTSILQLLFNAADLVVVGQFCGSVSLAAVGATGSLTSLMVNFFIEPSYQQSPSSLLPRPLSQREAAIQSDRRSAYCLQYDCY